MCLLIYKNPAPPLLSTDSAAAVSPQHFLLNSRSTLVPLLSQNPHIPTSLAHRPPRSPSLGSPRIKGRSWPPYSLSKNKPAGHHTLTVLQKFPVLY